MFLLMPFLMCHLTVKVFKVTSCAVRCSWLNVKYEIKRQYLRSDLQEWGKNNKKKNVQAGLANDFQHGSPGSLAGDP